MANDSKINDSLTIPEKVTLVAKEALKQLVQKRRLPWPESYEKEFWGVCYRDKLDELLKRRFQTKKVPKEVVEQFLRDTEEILGGVHDTVDEFVDGTRSGFKNMGDTIDALTKKAQDHSELMEDLELLSRYNEEMKAKAEATEKKLLEQAKTIEDLKGRLRQDPLTGLFNRHALFSDLKRELSRAARYEFPLSIIMVDIDDFKDINDTYGHITGDMLLKKLAAILKDSVRDSDSVYRYGGEEFVVLCPHTQCEQAYILGERLRQKVRRYRFVPEEASKTISISISVGVTQAKPDDKPEDVIRRADEALYKSKFSGKDQTTKICP